MPSIPGVRREIDPTGPRAARGLGRVATLVSAALAISLAACGGEDAASAAIPEDCLRSWNAESASLKFGKHVYDTHQSKQAQVTLLEPSKGAINIKGTEACAVVFTVAESDPEYGDVGLVITRFGWASLRELARGDTARLTQIQRAANEGVNAKLFPDGTLAPQ